jgi:glucose/arabinose dehydrogenase
MRLIALCVAAAAAVAFTRVTSATRTPPCAPDNAGLKLPAGFCATLFADSVPLARHMDVAPNGDVIVGTHGQPARPNATPPVPARPGGVIILRDRDGDGRAEERGQKFGDSATTTVKLVGSSLYAEVRRAIVRYRLPSGALVPSGAADTIVSGLPADRSHAPKTFAIHNGQLYVNHGSPSNVCQEAQSQPGSKGKDPCPELTDRAGIWRYDMNKTGQTIANGERFATGIRNAVAIAFEPRSNNLYVVQHGRDALNTNFPALFTAEKNAETPAEELFLVNRGDDFGWPYCYFDPELKQKVLAPEYGGDGKSVGRCADKKTNVGYFPGHWAPNSLLFYIGNALPAKYRNGAFIVFHGSWNRAPQPQQGYKVVFQPMANGRAAGDFEVIVDGFYENGQPTALGGRPMGLAQGRNGELYLSDDSRGRIFRIMYVGTR